MTYVLIALFIIIYFVSVLIYRGAMIAIAERRTFMYIMGLIPIYNFFVILIAYFIYAVLPLLEICWDQIKDFSSHSKNYIHFWAWYSRHAKVLKKNEQLSHRDVQENIS